MLSGGVALGAYQAGVFAALHPVLPVDWIAGSSVGAVNAALIAGTAAERRLETLRAYWLAGSSWHPVPWAQQGPLRHLSNWLSVAQARAFGAPRHLTFGGRRSFYDLAPTVSFLRKSVDFGRLNDGDIRLTVAAVDIASGEPVYFDTRRGDRIGVDHLLASCGFLPEFAPVPIDGRVLGDGGLGVNAPIEPVLDELEGSGNTVFVVDLFARDGTLPSGLEQALERKNALLFGNQTYLRLDLYRRLWQRHGIDAPSILYLSYRPLIEEAGPEAPFDFSHESTRDRWREGLLDSSAAIEGLAAAPPAAATVTVVRRMAAAARR